MSQPHDIGGLVSRLRTCIEKYSSGDKVFVNGLRDTLTDLDGTTLRWNDNFKTCQAVCRELIALLESWEVPLEMLAIGLEQFHNGQEQAAMRIFGRIPVLMSGLYELEENLADLATLEEKSNGLKADVHALVKRLVIRMVKLQARAERRMCFCFKKVPQQMYDEILDILVDVSACYSWQCRNIDRCVSRIRLASDRAAAVADIFRGCGFKEGRTLDQISSNILERQPVMQLQTARQVLQMVMSTMTDVCKNLVET